MDLNRIVLNLLLALLLGVGMGSKAGADPSEIGALRREYRELREKRTALSAKREAVVTAADELSARIDSLKGAGSDPDALHEALRASLGLVQRIVDIDRNLETLQSNQDSVRERLRLAYDWEIGQLIQQIDARPDEDLLAQLMVYQEERESLGTGPLPGELQYGAEMAVSPSDGPDEIRQKMELMEDVAARLRVEARNTRSQLSRLEEEHRLRSRVRVFAGEISLFDEHLPEGRILVRAQEELVADGAPDDRFSDERSTGVSGDQKIDTPSQVVENATRPILRGSMQTMRDGELQPFVSGVTETAVEIQKLRVRQQELRELEAVARERAASFRAHLKRMLEGGG